MIRRVGLGSQCYNRTCRLARLSTQPEQQVTSERTTPGLHAIGNSRTSVGCFYAQHHSSAGQEWMHRHRQMRTRCRMWSSVTCWRMQSLRITWGISHRGHLAIINKLSPVSADSNSQAMFDIDALLQHVAHELLQGQL